MVGLGLEPRVAKWKEQTNPLSYGGTPPHLFTKVTWSNINIIFRHHRGLNSHRQSREATCSPPFIGLLSTIFLPSH